MYSYMVKHSLQCVFIIVSLGLIYLSALIWFCCVKLNSFELCRAGLAPPPIMTSWSTAIEAMLRPHF